MPGKENGKYRRFLVTAMTRLGCTSQGQFAEMLGTNQGEISLMLGGHRTIRYWHILAVERLLQREGFSIPKLR